MHDKTLTELKAGLQAKDFSARELTEHFLDRVQARDGELNSFVTVTGNRPWPRRMPPTRPSPPATTAC